MGWWMHREKMSKGKGEELKSTAFKGYMGHICSYARYFENLDRPHDEQHRF